MRPLSTNLAVNFQNLLLNADWADLDMEDDVDVLWDLLLMKIVDILAVMCPYKRIHVRSRKTPWITREILYYMNERSKFDRIFCKTGSPEIFELCKYLRNKVNRMVRASKSSYIKENLNINFANPRKFWRVLKSVFNSKDVNTDIEFLDPVTNTKVDKTNTFFLLKLVAEYIMIPHLS